MKTKIKKVIQPEIVEEQEIEVSLPRYSKKDWHWYKVSEKGVIRVSDYDNIRTQDIEVSPLDSTAFRHAMEAEECSEHEFTMALNIVKAEIESQLQEELITNHI